MIDDFLFCDWDEPPDAMEFQLPYIDAIHACADHVDALVASKPSSGNAGVNDSAVWTRAMELYVTVPAIVNVALNYSVCVQFGLPLHPTVYFEVDPAAPHTISYGPGTEAAAFDLLARAIRLARAAYRLDPGFRSMAQDFLRTLPPGLGDFVYTSIRDKYTWRAAEPAKVHALARSIARRGPSRLIVGAAHGSIIAGLFLAELLSCDLWFLRFSMFKRNDREPVVSRLDEAYIRSFGDGPHVIVFDEDSASGTTLSILVERVKRIAPNARAAVVIRHLSSTFHPDHVGKTWWD